MNEKLLSIIEEQPITSDSCETICPDCDSTNIATKEIQQTLVGFGNHYWRKSYCRDCQSAFTHEHQNDNHWYTRYEEGVGTRALKGVSSCFEDYVYTCNKCPGYVKHYYTESDGVTPHTSGIITISLDGSEPKQREWYGCVICDNKIDITPKYGKSSPTELLEGWTIETATQTLDITGKNNSE